MALKFETVGGTSEEELNQVELACKEKSGMTPFIFVADLNYDKQYLFNEKTEKYYTPFIINKTMSGGVDTILYAQTMNELWHLPKKMQHDYYFYGLRKSKRYNKWLKREDSEDVQIVMKALNYNRQRALEVMPLITAEQLQELKERFSEKAQGGEGKRKEIKAKNAKKA